jgi:hypothetical protein
MGRSLLAATAIARPRHHFITQRQHLRAWREREARRTAMHLTDCLPLPSPSPPTALAVRPGISASGRRLACCRAVGVSFQAFCPTTAGDSEIARRGASSPPPTAGAGSWSRKSPKIRSGGANGTRGSRRRSSGGLATAFSQFLSRPWNADRDPSSSAFRARRRRRQVYDHRNRDGSQKKCSRYTGNRAIRCTRSSNIRADYIASSFYGAF